MNSKVMYQSICLLLKGNLFIDLARAKVKLGENANSSAKTRIALSAAARSPASVWGWWPDIASVASLE
jgi:hypothetical protein